MKNINFFKEEAPKFIFKNKIITKKWMQKVMANYGFTNFEIAFIFSNDAYVLNINQQFLKHDFYTDIITFDYSTKTNIESEIYISIDRIKENANGLNISFSNEFNRVLIHGILHLCGLKDKTKSEANAMRNAENEALILLEKMLQKK
jgi:rRNA maturation RNase YbeY